MRKVITYSLIAGVILVVLVLGLKVRRSSSRKLTVPKKEEISTVFRRPEKRTVKGEFDIQSAFIRVADEVGSAVVAISTERTQKVSSNVPRFRFRKFGGRSPFGDKDNFEKFFEDFFGQLPEKEFKQKGLGTGFIVDKRGYVLTNHHVVEGADVINITLPDGRSFPGKVKGSDPRSDLVIVKIDAKKLPVAKLGNSDLLQVGEWAVALGNPYGHIIKSPKPTVTVGVVSALHRQIPAPGSEGRSGYLDMIQTDAAINPGNSGGPLCDLNGRVIGINVVIFSTSGGYQGIGFAIPVNLVKDVLKDLISGKEIAYGWLGVSVQEITPELAEYFKLPDTKGALISGIVPDSPAEASDLKSGDIVIAFNDVRINEVQDLLKEVNKADIDEKARLNVIRDGDKKTIYVTIGKRSPKLETEDAKGLEVPEEAKKWRGISVASITDEIAEDLRLKDKDGVVIVDVDPRSSSYESGLREGDVIHEINKTKIISISDYKKAVTDLKGLVLINTDRGYVTVKEDEKK